jgi:hypothetical protein
MSHISQKIIRRCSILGDEPGWGLGRFGAIFLYAILFGAILYGLVVCRPIPNLSGGQANGEDLKCYKAIVTRIQLGESYYSAAGHELRSRGYTTASVFNWRLPLLAWFLGSLPSPRIAQAIVFLFTATSLILWLKAFKQHQYTSWQIILGGLLLSGPLIYCAIPGPFLMHEFWAGTLIVLSLAIYAQGSGYISALVGLAALFLRELAFPFAFVMLILAFIEGKRREALLWFLGIIIFSVEFFIHWSIVSRLITESDKVLKNGWIAFGGWPFALNTAQMHPFLILAPAWVAAVVVPLALFGLIGRRHYPWGIRITCTVGIYMLLFGIVGRSFNTYWGLMYAFLLPIGLLQAPEALKYLWQRLKIPFEA